MQSVCWVGGAMDIFAKETFGIKIYPCNQPPLCHRGGLAQLLLFKQFMEVMKGPH